jgi:exopolysaccharide biosynthesis polyprenyl glycosylphosphotransferase
LAKVAVQVAARSKDRPDTVPSGLAGNDHRVDEVDPRVDASSAWKGTWSRARDAAPGGVRAAMLGRPLGHPFLVDVASLTVGVAIAGAADQRVTQAGIGWGLLFVFVTFLVMNVRGLYGFRIQLSPLDDFSRIVSATSTSALVLLSVRLLANAVEGASNQAVRLWLASTVCLAGGRLVMALVLRRGWREGRGRIPTVIVGGAEVGQEIARRLVHRPELGLHPIGYLDEGEDEAGEGARASGPMRRLGRVGDLADVVAAHGAAHVIVGFGAASPQALLGAIRECRTLGIEVSVVPRLYEEVNRHLAVEHLGGIPLMRCRPVDPRGWQFTCKYALDRLVAGLLLLVLAVPMLLIALVVRLSSPGPVLYRQRRVGIDGREFVMLKFRTMRGDDARDGVQNAAWAAAIMGGSDVPSAPEDRRTGIGRLLRAFSLDELPQLLNVLRGDMSLVGPRPEQTPFVRGFNEQIHRYGDRHRVKCGVTGWAQIHGLRGNTSLAERVEWDNYYIENWSLWLDLRVLFLTLPAVLSRRGA